MMKRKLIGIVGALWLLSCLLLRAEPFVYRDTNTPPDALLAFRQSGSSFELVVNIGSIEKYAKAPAGSSFEVTQYSTGLLGSIVSSLNGVGWTVAGALKPTTPQMADYPVKTLWVTRPRSNPLNQSIPWDRKSQFTQGSAESRISSYGTGADLYSSLSAPGPRNTATAVVLPADYASGYSAFMGSGNLKNTFQGNIENTTPADFVTSGVTSRSDFYELKPGTGPGRYLGYFELRADGTIQFVAAGAVVPTDTIPPTVASVTPAPGAQQSLTQIGVVFSEPVAGVDASDLLVNGQPAIAASGSGTTWTFDLPAGLSGTVTASWAPQTGIIDLANPPNSFKPAVGGESWIYQINQVEVPKVTIAIRWAGAGWTVTAPSVGGIRYQLVSTTAEGLGRPLTEWAERGEAKSGNGSVLEWSGTATGVGEFFAVRASN